MLSVSPDARAGAVRRRESVKLLAVGRQKSVSWTSSRTS